VRSTMTHACNAASSTTPPRTHANTRASALRILDVKPARPLRFERKTAAVPPARGREFARVHGSERSHKTGSRRADRRTPVRFSSRFRRPGALGSVWTTRRRLRGVREGGTAFFVKMFSAQTSRPHSRRKSPLTTGISPMLLPAAARRNSP
jgi:hypothetical protein